MNRVVVLIVAAGLLGAACSSQQPPPSAAAAGGTAPATTAPAKQALVPKPIQFAQLVAAISGVVEAQDPPQAAGRSAA